MVVIIAVLGAISMKRSPDISFPIIKNTEAPLECLEDLNRKSFLVELNLVRVTTNLAEKTTVVGGGGKKRLLVVSAKDVIETQMWRRGEAPGPGEGESVRAGEPTEPGESGKHIPKGGWLDNNHHWVTAFITISGVERRN